MRLSISHLVYLLSLLMFLDSIVFQNPLVRTSHGRKFNLESYITSTASETETQINSLTITNFVKQYGIPSLLLFFLGFNYLTGDRQPGISPFDPQSVVLNGPFFQGWLFRTIDHQQNTSIILIVGSFSSPRSKIYDQHYIFCGIQTPNKRYHIQAFPTQGEVDITGGYSKLNMTWSAHQYGGFKVMNNSCEAKFTIQNTTISVNTTDRIPWSVEYPTIGGPEGWLASTKLLPCHYFIYSVGSKCQYSVHGNPIESSCSSHNGSNKGPWKGHKIAVAQPHISLKGIGYSHIEGNYGTFFPEGWLWTQAISSTNDASLSIVGGKFTIGSISPISFVIYYRCRQNYTQIYRTTDLDRFQYHVNGITGISELNATSLTGTRQLRISLIPKNTVASFVFGEAIYIPTAVGFLNQPGCKETYTAVAHVESYVFNFDLDRYELESSTNFPLTALEYGGSFQQHITTNI